MQKEYLILAYYHFSKIQNPQEFVKLHKQFFKNRDVKGRIYISYEGINGQMSGQKEDCLSYMSWLKAQSGFEDVEFKVDNHNENIFFKLTVKERKQLVAFDRQVDLTKKGPHLSPEEWKAHLEDDSQDYILIDTRNDYETKIGHFKDAELPNCQSFREFADYTKHELLEKRGVSLNKKILMYCTGGIRCEYYSAYMREQGFNNVYQLEGGVINYAHQYQDEHWRGKLFVFDDRLVTKLGEEPNCISTCQHCNQQEDTYYNCANMDCNYLFICCQSCLEKHVGCCKESCKSANRVRPYNHVSNKPFRKWYYYSSDKQAG